MARGRGRGLGGVRKKAAPPLPENINRRFLTREDSTLIDSVAGRDAAVLWPVSSFNGVDGSIVVPNTNLAPDFIEFETVVTKISLGEITQTLYHSSNSSAHGLQFRIDTDGKLSILKSGIASILSTTDTVSDGDKVAFDYDLTNGNVNIYINDVLSTGSLGNRTDFIFGDLILGSKTTIGNEGLGCCIHEVKITIDSLAIYIPLPQLGYGIDQNGQLVPLTVSGGVSIDYDPSGSKWLVEKGAVFRSPTTYGIEWNVSESTPDVKRVGSAKMHRELPIQSGMRRCLVTDAGVVTYLHADDSAKLQDGTTAILDGSAGQVMVEIPEFWYNQEFDGNIRRYLFSPHIQPGWNHIERHYISAFEAALERSTNKLSSVVNSDPDYRGGTNNAAWDAAANTLLGRPATYKTRDEFRVAAQNRGAGWYQYGVWDHYTTALLAVCEYATWNLQQPINTELTAEGLRQGGLGSGATTADSTEWSDYNGYNPCIPCGVTASLGNKSGEVDYVAADFGGVGIDRTFQTNSYRGVENPFGHLWKFMDGLNVNEHVAYVCDDPAVFADDTAEGYEEVGTLPSENGHSTDALNHPLPLPVQIGGSSTTYMCDYYYQSTGWRVALVGGNLNNGSNAGLFYLHVGNSSTYRFASIGARLSYRKS